MKHLLATAWTGFALCGCVVPGKSTLVVDVSRGTMEVFQGGARLKTLPVDTSQYGTGTRPGSRRTPLGTYGITKEPRHRYGPVFRLAGPQGRRRGILVHQTFGWGNGTNGCIAVKDLETMRWLYNTVNEETLLEIKP